MSYLTSVTTALSTNSISSARDVSLVRIDTPIGLMEGKTFKDILGISLSILNFIQYVDIESVFSCFVWLCLTLTDIEEKELVDKAVVTLVKYDIDVLQQAGMVVQEAVLANLEKLDGAILTQIKGLVATVGNSILASTTEGTSSDYDSITINLKKSVEESVILSSR